MTIERLSLYMLELSGQYCPSDRSSGFKKIYTAYTISLALLHSTAIIFQVIRLMMPMENFDTFSNVVFILFTSLDIGVRFVTFVTNQDKVFKLIQYTEFGRLKSRDEVEDQIKNKFEKWMK